MATKRPRNQGAIALRRTGLTQEQIAARLGMSQPQVQRWMACERVPSTPNRLRIYADFPDIEPSLWDQPAAPPKPSPTDARHMQQAPPATPISVRDGVDMLRGKLHKLLHRIDDDGTPDEQAKVLKDATAALHVLARITGEAADISEAKIVRLPAWRRVRDALVEALGDQPDVLLRVESALEEFGE